MKSPVTMAKDFLAGLAGARDAISALHDTDKGLRTLHGDLLAEHTHLLSARPPKEDVIAEAERQEDAAAAAWAAANGLPLVDAVAGRVEVSASGEVRIVGGDLLSMLALDARALLALAPAEVKRSLRAIISSTEYVAGPSLNERPHLIAEVAAKITDVEEQHSSLVDQARELGITIELLDEVRSRRASAAHRDEFRERAARGLARKIRS